MTSLEVFARHVQPDLPGCPRVIIADTIIKVVQHICEQADLLKTEITFSTVSGTRVYELTMPTGIVLSRVTNVRTAQYPNGLQSTSEFDAENSTTFGIPYAFYVDGLQRLGLVYTPNDIYTVAASVVMKPDHDTEELDTALYDHHLDIISDGVRSILMRQKNKEWSDSELSMFYSDRYTEGVTKARIASLSGNIGGSMKARPRRLGG